MVDYFYIFHSFLFLCWWRGSREGAHIFPRVQIWAFHVIYHRFLHTTTTRAFFFFLRKKVAFHIVGTHVLGDWICLPVPTQMAKTQFRGGRGRTKFQANSTFTQRSWEEEEGRKERKSWLLYLKLHLGTGRKWTKKTRPPFFLKSEKKNTLVYAFLMLAMWTAFW